MCGILGTTQKLPEEVFAKALDSISHRGPDDRGIHLDPNLSLGHRRLSIQDLSSNGHQPMSILNGQIWIVFNGEIYNHREIRRNLSGDFSYRSTSDTETILYGYLKYGKDVVKHLNGIFAFAIFDRRTNELFVARDQLGVKPLYYYDQDGIVAFASELKAFAKLPRIDLTVNPAAFVDYIQFLWSPGAGTPYRYVKKLEPGHYFCKQLGDDSPCHFTKYYELPYDGQYSQKSESELIDELDERLSIAVERQLLSDVPVGFFLSGGLDSSLIAAMAKKQIGGGFRSYTIEIPGKDTVDGFADDLQYAELVARHIDSNLIKVKGDSDIVRDFDKMIWHLDEPQADPAPLHVLSICKQARENGDIVLLGGTAGDDLFSGYRRHHALNLEKWFKLLPAFCKNAVNSLVSAFGTNSPTLRRIDKLARGIGLSPLERLVAYYSWISKEKNKSLFNEVTNELIGTSNPDIKLLDALRSIPNEKLALNQMLFLDTKFFLADHNLNYTDKMSMAVGVEVRVPFLDLDLVEFACRLPIQFKMRGNQAKYLLKKVAERYLPKEVIYRPKTGFGAPVRRWIQQGKMDKQIERLVSNSNSEMRPYFSRDALLSLVNDSKSGVSDGAYTIWSLMAIDSWLKQFASSTNQESLDL